MRRRRERIVRIQGSILHIPDTLGTYGPWEMQDSIGLYFHVKDLPLNGVGEELLTNLS